MVALSNINNLLSIPKKAIQIKNIETKIKIFLS